MRNDPIPFSLFRPSTWWRGWTFGRQGGKVATERTVYNYATGARATVWRPRPRKPNPPATPPMSTERRLEVYRAQNGAGVLTHRQARRMRHKANRMMHRAPAPR